MGRLLYFLNEHRLNIKYTKTHRTLAQRTLQSGRSTPSALGVRNVIHILYSSFSTPDITSPQHEHSPAY